MTETQTTTLELVATAEVAALFGVSHQRVAQLAVREDFPAPVAVLKAGRIWDRAAVVAWAESKGRAVRG